MWWQRRHHLRTGCYSRRECCPNPDVQISIPIFAVYPSHLADLSLQALTLAGGGGYVQRLPGWWPLILSNSRHHGLLGSSRWSPPWRTLPCGRSDFYTATWLWSSITPSRRRWLRLMWPAGPLCPPGQVNWIGCCSCVGLANEHSRGVMHAWFVCVVKYKAWFILN